MRTLGIDLGSRTVKYALLDSGQIVDWRVEYNHHDPLALALEMIASLDYGQVIATGYGRHLFAEATGCRMVTEIRAVAVGARFFVPDCRVILDIGGQDIKAVMVDERNGAGKFEMNDRCAAGTGRFLEVMATALGFGMNDFITAASTATTTEKVNAMCTVFAESEVVSLRARGADRSAIARGLHYAVAQRATGLLRRVSTQREIVFCGGVAQNFCLKSLIEETLGVPVVVPEHPQIVAAVGSALLAD